MYNTVNKVILIGIIGDKIEFRHIENDGAICRFSIATFDNYTDKISGENRKITDWHSVTCWGEQAKEIFKQIKKGHQIYLEAKLKMRTWQSKEGVTHKGYELFLDKYLPLNLNINDKITGNQYPEEGTPSTPAPMLGFELSDLDELPF